MKMYNLTGAFMKLIIGVVSIHYLSVNAATSFTSFHGIIIFMMVSHWAMYPIYLDIKEEWEEMKMMKQFKLQNDEKKKGNN